MTLKARTHAHTARRPPASTQHAAHSCAAMLRRCAYRAARATTTPHTPFAARPRRGGVQTLCSLEDSGKHGDDRYDACMASYFDGVCPAARPYPCMGGCNSTYKGCGHLKPAQVTARLPTDAAQGTVTAPGAAPARAPDTAPHRTQHQIQHRTGHSIRYSTRRTQHRR
eukprot:2296476-Prymnesium_polylepis.1